MAFDKEVKCVIDPEMDRIVDERGNSYIALRRVSWFDKEPKLEIRKWISTEDGDRAQHGVTFLTEDGPNDLTDALIEEGFGNTQNIIRSLSKRGEFDEALDTFLREEHQ